MLLIICSKISYALKISGWPRHNQDMKSIVKHLKWSGTTHYVSLCFQNDQYLKYILSYLILMVRHTHSWKAQAQAATTEGM